ncbi:MFS transporter [Silvimonas soli]|uniref:MFS transporter n=1 Tax=Silvimonas soli TaxID=2980100 RepID=UPI0024B39D1F|nr:MFS transporter [Silvimonas soli]
MTASSRLPWHTISALTLVSSFAQIGQFGFGFMVLPLWLAQHGLDAPRAGLFAAMQWTGMLVGLIGTPGLAARFGARLAVGAGLLISVAGFAIMPWAQWPLWLLAAFLIGAGLGVRWIANESWLYRLVPSAYSGRVVGTHETLIALAEIIAPSFAVWLGIAGDMPFIAGGLFTLSAVIPLLFARGDSHDPAHHAHSPAPATSASRFSPVIKLGMATAVVGGLCAGAFYGLFPLFTSGRGISSTDSASLLALFGLGAALCQMPIGWLADRIGLAGTVLISSVAAVVSSLLLLLSWSPALAAGAFLLGGVTAAFLTLAVYAAASSPVSAMGRNMRLITVTYTGSSILGPLGAGTGMNLWGGDALLWQEIGLVLLLGAVALAMLRVARTAASQI